MGRVKWFWSEPSRDPRLGFALRQLETGSATDDTDPLRQRIMAAARARLAIVEAPAPRWWEWLDRWLPVAVPAGLAASLAAGLLLPESNDNTPWGSYAVEVAADSTLVAAAFSADVGAEQVAAGLIAPDGGEWLFEQAVMQ
jgi:hypothetical protein